MNLDGIHHITAITGDAPRNVDFYTRVLGLRMTAKTVNQDDPSVYHLFYGDEPVGGAISPSASRPTGDPLPWGYIIAQALIPANQWIDSCCRGAIPWARSS